MSGHRFLSDEARAAFIIPDPGDAGAIPTGQSGTVLMVDAAAETRTLADPDFVGQQLMLVQHTYVGGITVTAATLINVSANTIMTFGAENECVLLQGVQSTTSGLRWQVVLNDNVSLS